jgi:FkbM family methyltransferase
MTDPPPITLRIRHRTFGLLVLATVSAAAAAWYAVRAEREPPATGPAPVQSVYEMDFFRKRYGPNHHTEREEEWMIRDYFQDRRGGVFVDVGANHYRATSKTYYLETQLGWSGIAIEPQREFAADYAKHRPRTKFLPFFVSDASNETARLYIIRNMSPVASSDGEFVKKFGNPDEVRDVPTITLNDLLEAEGVTTIDFLSMDIELHEPKALRGFAISRFKPSLVCIEALLPVRQQILEYFARNGYVLVGKYVWVDLENLYFAPLPALGAEPALPAER